MIDTRYFNRTEPTLSWWWWDGLRWFTWITQNPVGRCHAEPIEDEV